MALPYIVFWGLLWFARRELGWRGVAIFVGIWAGLLAACIYSGLSPYVFVAAQAVLDCILILVIFKGDIRVR